MRDVFLDALLKRALADPRVMLVTADLGFKVLDNFREQCPKQYLNIGISEQNMIGVSVGLALSGRIVFAYSIANFPSLRCLEQIRNDACYHNANVKIISIGAGLSYGQLGISHHATEDISIMRAIPNLRVYSPGTDDEVIACANRMIDQDGTAYIRIDREGVPNNFESLGNFRPDKIRIINEGKDLVLVSTGGMLGVALEAKNLLQANGLHAAIINIPTLAPFDASGLNAFIKNYTHVFTLEEHSVHGGLGGLVAETLLEYGHSNITFYRFGIRDGFSSIVGDQKYLRKCYGIDANSISSKISEIFGKTSN